MAAVGVEQRMEEVHDTAAEIEMGSTRRRRSSPDGEVDEAGLASWSEGAEGGGERRVRAASRVCACVVWRLGWLGFGVGLG